MVLPMSTCISHCIWLWFLMDVSTFRFISFYEYHCSGGGGHKWKNGEKKVEFLKDKKIFFWIGAGGNSEKGKWIKEN